MADEEFPRAWTQVAVRSVKDFQVFKAQSLDVQDPRNATVHVRTVLQAPDWVNVIPLTESGEVVLVRQFRFGTWANTLEIPGGMVDPGEDALQAAARELEEETGFRAASLTLLGISHPNPALFNNRLHCFLAHGCTQVHGGQPEGTEDIQVVTVPRENIPSLVRDGVISHALVLAAFLYEAWKK